MTEEIINLKDYFVHHYDDWGRLYCVEFKGNPLELENSIKRLEQENNSLQAQVNNITVQSNNAITALEQENKNLYEEKNCLHKIIDRLLENAGYSKDIASAEDFEDVYEDMQIKRNELIELEQENKELKTWLESKEKQLKHLIKYNQNKKDQIKTLKFMLFDEKEIPKDKFTMMYRIAQNERRTKSHRDLCTNITKKYRSALEEINLILDELKQQYDYMTDYSEIKEIQDKINEVLSV